MRQGMWIVKSCSSAEVALSLDLCVHLAPYVFTIDEVYLASFYIVITAIERRVCFRDFVQIGGHGLFG